MSIHKTLPLAIGLLLLGSQVGQAADFGFVASNPTEPLPGTVFNFGSLPSSNTANESFTTGGSPYSTPIGSLALNGAQIVNGAQGGEFAVPYGTGPSANYLSVYQVGSAVFTLTQAAGTFGIDWGSIDPSNQILFTDTKGNQFTLTGSEIDASANGDQGINGTDKVMVTSEYGITSAVLTSGQNSFEVGAVSVSPVPIPGALLLFGSAVAGLAVFGLKKKHDTAVVA